MITRILSLLVAMACISTQVAAQSILVRSGEHEDFSRLVFDLPSGANWRLKQVGKSVSVAVDGASVRFDLTTVFDRIPRNRISALSQKVNGAPLEISLACDCQATAFVQSGRHLVIDVSTPNRPASTLIAKAVEYRYRQYDPMKVRGMSNATRLLSLPKDASPAEIVEKGLIKKPTDAMLAETRTLPDPKLSDALNISQQRLLREIASAADQGILTPNQAIRFGDVLDVASEELVDRPEIGSDTQAEKDRSTAQLLVRDRLDDQAGNCVATSAVAVSDWTEYRDFQEGLGQLRSRLYSDAGELRTDNVLALAKFYVFHGFGQEALTILRGQNSANPEVALTTAIARLIDSDPSERIDFLAEQQGCATDISLWWILSRIDITNSPERDVANASVRAFAKLPRHLRRHLGPRLSQKFLNFGDPGKAADVLRLIDKRRGTPQTAELLAQAEIDLRQGREDKAIELFERATASGDDVGPEALVRLIETSFFSKTPMREGMSDLAESFATEFQGSELGRRLQRAWILSLIMEDRFATALNAIANLPSEADPQSGVAMRSETILALAERADDMTFLNLAFQELDRPNLFLSPDAGNQMAGRLLSLGFLNAADRILNSPGTARKSEARKKLRARVALQGHHPNRALIELVGLSDSEATELRAQAFVMLGEYAQAAESFQEARDSENVARARWLDNAWDLIPSGEQDRFSSAASLTETILSDPAAAIGPLSQARQLLQASRKTRVSASKLLDVLPFDASEPATQTDPLRRQ